MPLTLRPSACSPTVPRSSPSCTIQTHDMMLARFQQSFWAIRSQTSRGEQKRIGRIQRLRRRTCSGTALCFFFAPSSPRGRRQQFLTGCLARPARQLKCMHAHACMLARLPACLPACHPCSRHPSARSSPRAAASQRRRALRPLSCACNFPFCHCVASGFLDGGWMHGQYVAKKNCWSVLRPGRERLCMHDQGENTLLTQHCNQVFRCCSRAKLQPENGEGRPGLRGWMS